MRPMLLIPVKGLDLAKSRLNLPADRRRSVARMLMERTLSTARASVGLGGFTVVTSDDEVKTLTEVFGGTVIHDPHDDLNQALDSALAELRSRDPDRTVVVLVADLPLLRRHDLDNVLTVVAQSAEPRIVLDLSGAGTTSVSLPSAYAAPMTFGPNSAKLFQRAGFLPIADAPYGARADLDTTDQLALLHYGARSGSNSCYVPPSACSESPITSQAPHSAFAEHAHLMDPNQDPLVNHPTLPQQIRLPAPVPDEGPQGASSYVSRMKVNPHERARIT